MTTTFEHVKNPDPVNVRDWTWAEFVEFVEGHGHERVDEKEATYLFGNYKLKDGTKSANANIEAVFAWALDLDKLSRQAADDVLERLVADDLAFLVYSTHSHSAAKPKLRVVGPLSRPVPGKDWRPVWRALIDKYSPGADEQCKDPRRLYYWPSAKPGAPAELYSNPGRALDVEALPVAAAPRVAPDLDAKEIVDGGFRVDRCPTNRSVFEHGEALCRTMPAAVSGQGGSVSLLRLARALAWGLELEPVQAASLIGELYNPRCAPAWTDAEIEHKVADANEPAGAPYARGALKPAEPDSFDHLPICVQNNGRYWLRERDGDDYYRSCTKDDLPIVVRKHYPAGTHEFYTDGDEMPKLAEMAKFFEPVSTVVGCYFNPKSTYDPKTEVLTQGLRIDPSLVAGFDPDVEKFLAAYGGDELENLKKWISSCRPDRLTAPARALAIVGPKGPGKSLVPHALARIWNADVVPAGVLCARFNGALAYCPIVLADEEMPPDLTGEAFRTVIQSRRHSIEPKGKERHSLHGCIRMVVTANDLSKLHLLGGKGRDDVAAIADRFFLLHLDDARAAACIEAQKPLLGDDGSTVNVERMARHFLHIMQTVEPERGRFIGSAGDGGAMAVTLAAETERAPEVFDLVRAFVHEGWGAQYKVGAAGIPKRGEVVPEAKRNAPFVVKDFRVFVRLPVLGQLVGRDQRDVTATLKPFLLGRRAALELGGATFDAYEIDAFALAEALELDADRLAETLSTDTADRQSAGTT